MEECEALCTRLVIMVNGRFQCLGSIQQLKSKFGEGYTLTAKIKTLETDTSTNDSSSSNDESRFENVKELDTIEPDTKPSLPHVYKEHSRTSTSTDQTSKKLANFKMHEIKTFIENSFPGSSLKDQHLGFVQYEISNKEVNWAELFRQMEYAKGIFNLEDYSVSQTSLEQVFLTFARKQHPPTRTDKNKCCGRGSYCCCAIDCGYLCSCRCKLGGRSITLPISS